MKNSLVKITCFTFMAAALIAAPASLRAEDATNAPSTNAPAMTKKHPPIHGKVAAVDATAMTFTIGETTAAVTSETKILKDGTPAVFADITVGENASCVYKKDAAGKVTAITVRLGEKKKKPAAE